MRDVARSRPLHRILAAIALGLGSLAVVAGSPRRETNARIDVEQLARIVESEDDHVTALELAEWIKEGRPNLRIVDVRDSASYESYHLPRAERIALRELSTARFGKSETIVLYSDGGAHAAQGWVFLRALGFERVYFLRGGVLEWLDEVMNPVVSEAIADSAKADRAAEISRYFGGVPRSSASVPADATPVRRRGC